MARRAAKIDINQPEIVKHLRKVGATVEILSAVGKGCPDIMVGFRGVNYLMEIKSTLAKKKDNGLTEDQVEWHSTWAGKVYIVRSIAEALNVLGISWRIG